MVIKCCLLQLKRPSLIFEKRHMNCAVGIKVYRYCWSLLFNIFFFTKIRFQWSVFHYDRWSCLRCAYFGGFLMIFIKNFIRLFGFELTKCQFFSSTILLQMPQSFLTFLVLFSFIGFKTIRTTFYLIKILGIGKTIFTTIFFKP